MALGSKSDFFRKVRKDVLKDRARGDVKYVLDYRLFTAPRRNNILKAYDYFVENPLDYDGSTGSQDLHDIVLLHADNKYKLEIGSVPHDYYYKKGAFYSKKLLRIADKMLRADMRMFDKSGFEIGRRMVFLWFLREVLNYAMYKRFCDNVRLNSAKVRSAEKLVLTDYKFY